MLSNLFRPPYEYAPPAPPTSLLIAMLSIILYKIRTRRFRFKSIS
uniref:Uncharacterized protein n=2 Tax=Rhizophora mucronata TaxID=61149 RepID=A0A2P2M9N9_RHIMU